MHGDSEPAFEPQLTCQPRPNVVLEAGMALLGHPNRTIIVQVGDVRPISDLSGRSMLHLGRQGSLRALAERLVAAGCPADLESEYLTNDKVFADLAARGRQPSTV